MKFLALSSTMFQKMIAYIALAFCLLGTTSPTFAAQNLNLRDDPNGGVQHRNDRLEDFGGEFSSSFFSSSKTGEEGLQSLLFRVAQDLKNVFIFVAIIYLIVTVMKLLFSSGKDEEMKNAINSLVWTIAGIMVMQSSYTVITLLYNQWVGWFEAKDFLEGVVYHFLHFIELGASFIFVGMGIYAFYLIVTNADDSKDLAKGKMTIVNAILGFMFVKLAWVLVGSMYGTVQCQGSSFMGIQLCTNALTDPNTSEAVRIGAVVINYINGFIFLVVVLSLVYAGWLILSAGGDDKQLGKAKKVITYAFMGVVLIVVSLILFNLFSGLDGNGSSSGVRFHIN